MGKQEAPQIFQSFPFCFSAAVIRISPLLTEVSMPAALIWSLLFV